MSPSGDEQGEMSVFAGYHLNYQFTDYMYTWPLTILNFSIFLFPLMNKGHSLSPVL